MVSLFRSSDKDKEKNQSRGKEQDGNGTSDGTRRSEDGGNVIDRSNEASSSTSTPSRYRLLRRKNSVKTPSRAATKSPAAAQRDSLDGDTSPSQSVFSSGLSELPTASTFASFRDQQDGAPAASALGFGEAFGAALPSYTSPSGRTGEASKREGRVFGVVPRLPELSTDDEAGPVGWRGNGGSLDLGSGSDHPFEPEFTPRPTDLEPPLAFPTALSPPRRSMPRSPRPPPRESSSSQRNRIQQSNDGTPGSSLSSDPPSPLRGSNNGVFSSDSPSRRGAPSPSGGLRTSTAEWLSRPPTKLNRRPDGHGRSTSASALSAMTRRNLSLHDESGTSSESAEEFGSDVGVKRKSLTRMASGGTPDGYEVEVSCSDTRGENNEIKWEIIVRQKSGSGGDPSGSGSRPAIAPSSPLQLGPAGQLALAPSSASSINLSLALDQPSGKLVFIAIPMNLESTPRHQRHGSRSSPRLGSAGDRNSRGERGSSNRNSPVPEVPRIPSRLSSAADIAPYGSTAAAVEDSRPSTPPPAPHPASTATLPITPVSKRREGSQIYDRSFASPYTPSASRTPARVLQYMSPSASMSPAPGSGSSAGAALHKRRPSGSIANAARRSSLEGFPGAPMSPGSQRRSRIVSADELAGGLFAPGTVGDFSEQLEDAAPIQDNHI